MQKISIIFTLIVILYLFSLFLTWLLDQALVKVHLWALEFSITGVNLLGLSAGVNFCDVPLKVHLWGKIS